MRQSFLFLVVLFVFAASCGKPRVQKLSERADSYNRALRWSSITAASTLIAEDVRRSVIQDLLQKIGRNRIVDYSIVDLGVDPEEIKASILVEFSYYGISDQDLKYRQEVQNWAWDSRQRDWFLRESRDLPAPK